MGVNLLEIIEYCRQDSKRTLSKRLPETMKTSFKIDTFRDTLVPVVPIASTTNNKTTILD